MANKQHVVFRYKGSTFGGSPTEVDIYDALSRQAVELTSKQRLHITTLKVDLQGDITAASLFSFKVGDPAAGGDELAIGFEHKTPLSWGQYFGEDPGLVCQQGFTPTVEFDFELFEANVFGTGFID